MVGLRTTQPAAARSVFSLACWRLMKPARCLLLSCVLKYAVRLRAIALRYAAKAF
jgi:hypothetical protein